MYSIMHNINYMHAYYMQSYVRYKRAYYRHLHAYSKQLRIYKCMHIMQQCILHTLYS